MNILAIAYLGIGIVLSIIALPLFTRLGWYKREGWFYWIGFIFFWPLMIYVVTGLLCMTAYKKWNNYQSKKEFEKKQR